MSGLKKSIKIENQSRPLAAPLQAVFCDSFICRLRGLMFRKDLPAHQGLLLVYDKDSRMDAGIHMMFVWFDLGVVWINSAGEVVDTVVAKKWRPAYLPKSPARYVLEIVPRRLSEFKTGDRIRFLHENSLV